MSKQTVYLAGGCFWGLEDLFKNQVGVTDTEVGYCGGDNDYPTYENHPGHAETLAISFDSTKTSYANILDFFFRIHDPTTINRQGNDIGSSYRSAIFYRNEQELTQAKEIIAKVNESGIYRNTVVTTLEPFNKFWTAEEYHQDYLTKHPGGYTCHFVRTEKHLI